MRVRSCAFYVPVWLLKWIIDGSASIDVEGLFFVRGYSSTVCMWVYSIPYQQLWSVYAEYLFKRCSHQWLALNEIFFTLLQLSCADRFIIFFFANPFVCSHIASIQGNGLNGYRDIHLNGPPFHPIIKTHAFVARILGEKKIVEWTMLEWNDFYFIRSIEENRRGCIENLEIGVQWKCSVRPNAGHAEIEPERVKDYPNPALSITQT